MTVRFEVTSQLPTPWGEFAIHAFEDLDNDKEIVVLSMGNLGGEEPVLARIHSECLTGDALFSMRCDCGSQLRTAMEKIAEEKRGMLVYLRQEGRGIGLLNKIRAYQLQDDGADTVEANEQLGFGADMRDYGMCKEIFAHFDVNKLCLMTNNPRKVEAVEKLGVEVTERVALRSGHNPHNADYLATKFGKLGHINDDD
ncbi:MAG: GTP cyclohydrolase II [Pseudomonadales bacterium]